MIKINKKLLIVLTTIAVVLSIVSVLTDVGLSASLTGSTVKNIGTSPSTALSVITMLFIIGTLVVLTVELARFLKK